MHFKSYLLECKLDNIGQFKIKTKCISTLKYVFIMKQKYFLQQTEMKIKLSVEGHFCNFLQNSTCDKSNKTLKNHWSCQQLDNLYLNIDTT